MQKLMIIDGSARFVAALEDALADEFYIIGCCDPEIATDMMQRTCPDILVINLSLPHKDGITILQQSSFRPPIILAITGYVSNYIVHRLGELGVTYTMLMPSLSSLCLRIRDLAQHGATQPDPADPHSITAHHLHLLNIPTHRDGYRQLLAAIPLYTKNPHQLMTKELYPQVAKLCGCRDGRAVEHSIRKAVHAAWEHGDPAVWQKFFSPGPRGTIPCPSNKAFISRLAELLDTDIF